MPTTAPLLKRFWRMALAHSPVSTTPETFPDWNVDPLGWVDIAADDANNLNYVIGHIAPTLSTGVRSAKTVTPVGGRQDPALGQLAGPVIVELLDRFLVTHMGQPVRTPTAGVAALVSTAWLSVATLDTQPANSELLEFTIVSSTDATGASIDVVQNALTVETITIPDNVGTVDGVYSTKRAYDGGTNAVTFVVAGTVTAGMVAVAGVVSKSSVFKYLEVTPDAWVEQHRVEAGPGAAYTNSQFFGGVKIPEITLAYDNSIDGFFAWTASLIGGEMLANPQTTFAQDALLYHPFANWTAAVTIDGADIGCEVAALSLTMNNGDVKIQGSTGNQFSCASGLGQVDVNGDLTLTLFDDTHWVRHTAAGTLYNLVITLTSPALIATSVNPSFTIRLPRVDYTTYTPENSGDGASQGATVGLTAIYDQTEAAELIITTVGQPMDSV